MVLLLFLILLVSCSKYLWFRISSFWFATIKPKKIIINKLAPGKNEVIIGSDRKIYINGKEVANDYLSPGWVDYAKKRGMGIDFNPTYFSHPMVKDNLTLSSPDEEVRKFWVEHGKACLRISEYFANETGIPCVMNIWIPDGYKDIPADRLGDQAKLTGGETK